MNSSENLKNTFNFEMCNCIFNKKVLPLSSEKVVYLQKK